MPSQPPDPYSRQFNFTGHEQTLPTKPLPGSKVDLELNEVRESLNATISRLNEIQADDGSIRDAAISGILDQKVTAAESARNDAVSAKVEAVAAKDQSQVLFNNINGYGTSVLIQANSSQLAAFTSAQEAALSASSASDSYQQTQTLAGQITASGNTAAASAATAQSAAATATSSSSSAQTYAIDAGNYRNQAAVHASNALASSNSAATSFQQAQNSSNSAGTHAFNAAQSAVDAEASAQAAETAAASVTGVTYTAPLQKVGSEVSIDPAYKPNPFDQTLNTTDSPTFGQVFVGQNLLDSLLATLPDIVTDAIQFGDSTIQTTAVQNGQIDKAIPTWNASTSTWDTYANGGLFIYDQAGTYVAQSRNSSISGIGGGEFQVAGDDGLGNNFEAIVNPSEVSVSKDTGAFTYTTKITPENITFADSTVQTTAAPPVVDIQTFGGPTTSGTFTWTKPAGAKMVQVRMFGGGGGGAGGLCTITANARTGGGGGGGGASSLFLIPASELGDTVSVIVGAGGAGGAGRDTVGAHNAGTNGGFSQFGNYRVFFGNGATSQTAGSGFVGTLFNIINSAAAGVGGAGAATNGVTATSFSGGQFHATGGGGGAGQPGGSTAGAVGGAGGSRVNGVVPVSYVVSLAGGSSGNAAGTSGGNGTNQDVALAAGTGGGGGGYATGVATGNGGNGGWPGGGGGGGAASDVGFMSGTGGTGGNGMVTVITYF